MTDIVLSIRELDDYEEIYVVNEKDSSKEIENKFEGKKSRFTSPPVQLISDSDTESLESVISSESEFELLRQRKPEQGYPQVFSGSNYCNFVSKCCPYIRTYTYSNFKYASSIYNNRIVPYIRGIRDEIRNLEQNAN